MTVYRTCRICVKNNGACEDKKLLRSTMKGFHVTSIKHKCPAFEAPFAPGQAITMATVESDGDEYYHESTEVEYPGHFLGDKSGKAFIYIRPGVEGSDGMEFEARANGFCKIPYYRVKARESASIDRCCEHGCDDCEFSGFKVKTEESTDKEGEKL